MSWVRFALKHPVPTIVAFLVLLVLGGVSITRLPVDLYPAMEFPLAVVATRYEGAGPREVESLVSRPMEEVLGTIGGVTSIRSQNFEGQSLVIVQFDWGTNMDQGTLQMREKVDQVRRFLPDGVEQPMVVKIDPQALPVVTLGLTGGEDLIDLKRLAEDRIKPRLERIDGVASVSIQGGTEREIQVIVDPGRLQAAGISIAQVAQALRYENLNLPGGEVQEGPSKLLVRTIGEFESVDDIRNLRLGTLRLADIAEVHDTYAAVTSKAWIDGREAIGIDIQKQSGANTVTVANAIKAELAALERDLPGNVQSKVLLDQSSYVMNSISGITSSGISGGFLAVVILLLFLRHLRATVVVAMAIPISLIATFAPLFFGGVSLNILSMGGLILGVGMVVDSAIVVLENIFRHKQMGKDTGTAALEGAGEVTLAVAASTLTTVAVFLPVVFITGLAQQYFRELALSVTYSLVTSLAVSLTIVPIMATWLLRERKGPAKEPARLIKLTETLVKRVGAPLDKVNEVYGRTLPWALSRPWMVMGSAFLSLALAGLLFTRMGMEFIPNQDTGEFRVTIKMPAGTVLSETERAVSQAAEMIRDIPELDSLYVTVGSAGEALSARSGNSNEAGMLGLLVRPSERKRSLDDVIEEVRERLLLPGAEVAVEVSGALNMAGAAIEILIKGEDLGILEVLAEAVAIEVSQVPGTREITSSVSEGLPEVQVRVDRARAATYYLSPSQIASAVQQAVKGQVVSQFRVGGKEYDIRLQATEEARRDVAALTQLPIATPAGSTVPLGDVATVTRGVGPTVVEREDQARVVKVTGQIHNRDLGSVMSEIKARLGRMPLPPDYTIDYGGQDREMQDAFGGLLQALLFSVVLVYLVMAAQFESFLHPFVIMGTVPLAIVGAIFGLVLTGRNLDMSAMIGMILLVGIVVNNAILLIDYINQLRREGMGRQEAILLAGPTRLRPVLMTTLTTLLGLLPLSLGLSEGSDLLAPMATVVIGGLALSTLLTLLVIPVAYTLVDELVIWVQERFLARLN